MAAIAATANVSILQLGGTFKLPHRSAAAAGQVGAIEEAAAAAGILGNSGVQVNRPELTSKTFWIAMAKNAELAGVKTSDANGDLRNLLDVMR